MAALDDLKAFIMDDFTPVLWTFKKSSKDQQPVFTGHWVDTSDELDATMKSAVGSVVNGLEETLEYSLLAENNVSSALSITALETHAGLISAQCANEIEQKKVKDLKQIDNSAFYVIKLTGNGRVFYAVKATDDSWKTKKSKSAIQVLFKNNELSLDTDPGFNLSRYIDFFIVGDEVLVCSKPKFEATIV